MQKTTFEWDEEKDKENLAKYNVSFAIAQYAFFDQRRVMAQDFRHSAAEERCYCIGLCRWRHNDSEVYISGAFDTYLRRWLLEERQEDT